MYLVIANVVVKDSEMSEVLEKLENYIELVLKSEPGTLYFDVKKGALISNMGSSNLTILEGYKNRKAYEDHVNMPYRAERVEGIRQHLEDGRAEHFERIDGA